LENGDIEMAKKKKTKATNCSVCYELPGRRRIFAVCFYDFILASFFLFLDIHM
jgi:hypothetical protein